MKSECAHCNRPMNMEIDSEMNCTSLEEGCNPIVFVPDVKFERLKDPSIIDAF